MSETLSECGVILKKIPYSESDEILVALLQNHGVVRFFARGSRSSKKRFGGRADVFRHSHFLYKPAREGQHLLSLIGLEDVVDTPSAQQALESNLIFFAVLSYFAEIIVEFLPEGANSSGIYEHWMNVVRDFDPAKFSDDFLEREFVQHLLGFLADFGFAYEPRSKNPLEIADEVLGFVRHTLQKKLRTEDFLRSLFPNLAVD